MWCSILRLSCISALVATMGCGSESDGAHRSVVETAGGDRSGNAALRDLARGASQGALGLAAEKTAIAADSLVPPVCNSVRQCTFAWEEHRVVVDAAFGGRVVEMSMGGRNILVTKDMVDSTFGSTFWTSPQSDWGWPPIVTVDTADYAVTTTSTELVLTSSEFTIGERKLVVEKTLSADRVSNKLHIRYTIQNKTSQAVSIAPWEITRVRINGLTFFPNPASGQALYASTTWTPMMTENLDGHTFFPYDASQIPEDRKLFADGGQGGYLAHADEDLLFVKRWTDVAASGQAPEEAEIELYANKAHTYIEIEEQGPYASIPAGQQATFAVDWSLVRLTKPIGTPSEAVADPAWRAMLVDSVERTGPVAPRTSF